MRYGQCRETWPIILRTDDWLIQARLCAEGWNLVFFEPETFKLTLAEARKIAARFSSKVPEDGRMSYVEEAAWSSRARMVATDRCLTSTMPTTGWKLTQESSAVTPSFATTGSQRLAFATTGATSREPGQCNAQQARTR